MNKQELLTSMVEKVTLEKTSKKEAEAYLKAFIESVEETVAKGEKVGITGFGTFESKLQKGREGECKLSTAQGKKWKTEDKNIPKFSASKNFKEIVAEGK